MNERNKLHVADVRLQRLRDLPTRQCQCERCQEACTYKPGWFAPGEAELAARKMKLTLQQFFDEYLMVDYLDPDEDTGLSKRVLVLSPAITRGKTGAMFPSYPGGQCVLFKDGKCSIHRVKPLECKVWSCNDDTGESQHIPVGLTWDKPQHQLQIQRLLDNHKE